MEQLEIDGVPVLWQPAPGPLNASLIFRVGRRDETFVRPLDEILQALRAAGYAPVEEDRDGSRVLRP